MTENPCSKLVLLGPSTTTNKTSWCWVYEVIRCTHVTFLTTIFS
jgi:hypothetical protein